MMKYLFIILIVLSSFLSIGQSNDELSGVIDSLENVVNTSKSDTTVLKAIREWDNLIYISDPEKDLELLKKASEICAKGIKNSKSKTANIV